MSDSAIKSSSLRSILVALAVAAGLAISNFSAQFLRPLADIGSIGTIPYLYSAIVSGFDIIVLCLLVGLAASVGPLKLTSTAGLGAPVARPLIWTILWLAPALAVCLWSSPLARDVSAADIAWLAFGGPIAEEIVYRGLAIGALMGLAGWKFLPAALLPALVFGIAHVANGETPSEAAGVVAITAAGGLLFGWLFVRWGVNLWPAIFLHIALNGLWVVFALGDNAIGGWLGNALRLGIVTIAIAATFWLAPNPSKPPQPSPRYTARRSW